MNTRRCYVSVTVLAGMIFAMGGYDGHNRQSTAEKYDPATNQWTLLPNMNVARSDADATTLNGRIYITGKDAVVDTRVPFCFYMSLN